MRTRIIVLASLLIASGARAGNADSSGMSSTVLRPFVGAFIPTGTQHEELSKAVLTGAQLGYDLPFPMRLVGSIGWTPSHDRDFSDTRSSIFQYDAGLELGRRAMPDQSWQLSPFIGAGLGARTYRFRQFSSSDQTDFAGYGAVGGELLRSRLGARVEVRDYVSRFQPIVGESQSTTRNDLTVMGGLTFHL